MKALTSAGLLALLLSGCGQTGPLYMPDNEDARERYDPQGAYEPDSRDEAPNDAPGERESEEASMESDNVEVPEDTGVDVPEAGESPITPSPSASGVSATVGGAPATPGGGL